MQAAKSHAVSHAFPLLPTQITFVFMHSRRTRTHTHTASIKKGVWTLVSSLICIRIDKASKEAVAQNSKLTRGERQHKDRVGEIDEMEKRMKTIRR